MQLAILIGGLCGGDPASVPASTGASVQPAAAFGDVQAGPSDEALRAGGYIVVPDSSVQTRLARRLMGDRAGDHAETGASSRTGYIEVPLNTMGDEDQSVAEAAAPIEDVWYDDGTVRYYRQALIGADPYEQFGITRLRTFRPPSDDCHGPAPRGETELVADRFTNANRRAQLHFGTVRQ